MTTTTQTETTTMTTTDAAVAAAATKAPKSKKSSKAGVTTPVIASKNLDTAIAYEPGIESIPLDQVDAGENLTRPDGIEAQDDKEFLALVESIKSIGQQVPVSVQRQTGEFAPYKLVAGFRRFAAVRAAGIKTVQARVMLRSDEVAAAVANVTENANGKRDVGALGLYAGFARLESLGFSTAAIAQMSSKAEDYVRDILRLTDCVEEIRAALKLPEGAEGSTSWAVARLLMRLPKGEQATMLRRVGHLSVSKAREVLADHRAAKRGESRGDDEGDEGEGEGKSSKASKGGDVVVPEPKVMKLTVPLWVAFGDEVATVREAYTNLDQKKLEASLNSMARMLASQEKALRALFGDKEFEKAVKAEKQA